jgi:hypothetical protein
MLSGHESQRVTPGLKPWAILSNHFMVKPRLFVSYAKSGTSLILLTAYRCTFLHTSYLLA